MRANDGGQYVIIWEFRVRPGFTPQYEQIYGPDGEWNRLFRRGKGYIRTELLRDPTIPGRYLTIDVWRSRGDYDNFHQQHAEEYRRIDRQCEEITERESALGTFERVCPGS